MCSHRARTSWCEGFALGVQKRDERWSEKWNIFGLGFVWSSRDARDEDEWWGTWRVVSRGSTASASAGGRELSENETCRRLLEGTHMGAAALGSRVLRRRAPTAVRVQILVLQPGRCRCAGCIVAASPSQQDATAVATKAAPGLTDLTRCEPWRQLPPSRRPCTPRHGGP